MSELIAIKTPDLGDFPEVPVIEIYVKVGDTIAVDEPLLAVESDKATMEIPANQAGVIQEILVSIGEAVSHGQVLMMLAPTGDTPDHSEQTAPVAPATTKTKTDSDTNSNSNRDTATPSTPPPTLPQTDTYAPALSGRAESATHAPLVVIGGGPGGYSAAFRAADLGLSVTLIERYATLGGVCLNVGCIPSKALLHVAKVITDAREAVDIGVQFGRENIDVAKILSWKNGIVQQLTTGLRGLAKKRKVRVLRGVATFTTANELEIQTDEGIQTLSFDQAIIAAGSQPATIPPFPTADPRIIDSTAALAPTAIPKKLLVVGGGVIGLEMATVYHALGSKISIVEMLDGLMAGADADLVRPLHKRLQTQYDQIWTQTRVTKSSLQKNGIRVHFDGADAPDSAVFDQVLVAVGRVPNGHQLAAARAGVGVDTSGFIAVDLQQRTNIPHIFAVGDIVGQPMLAHKAVHQAKVAAEVAAGMKSGFDARVIPNVAYTDPEVAWAGLTEIEAKAQGVAYGKGVFPWAASGRSLAQGRNDGSTKLLFDPKTERIIGAGVVGGNAGDLIAEAVVAIEMNATAEDLALSIHPHPTLAETLGFAAEMFSGTITDLYAPKRPARG